MKSGGKKIVRIYGTDEMMGAFREMEDMKAKGYGGTLSFVRGKKTADIQIKIEYTNKLNH
jgi:hypothetical protein